MAEGRESPFSPTAEDTLSVDQQSRKRLYSVDSIGDPEVPHMRAQMANTHLEHLALLDIFSQPHIVRNTGIVCTIGKAVPRKPELPYMALLQSMRVGG